MQEIHAGVGAVIGAGVGICTSAGVGTLAYSAIGAGAGYVYGAKSGIWRDFLENLNRNSLADNFFQNLLEQQ